MPCYCMVRKVKGRMFCIVSFTAALHITPLSPWRGVGGEARMGLAEASCLGLFLPIPLDFLPSLLSSAIADSVRHRSFRQRESYLGFRCPSAVGEPS